MTSTLLPTSFFSATDGQTASRTYRSTVAPGCSVTDFSHFFTSGLPSVRHEAIRLGRPVDFGVDIRLGDGQPLAVQLLLQNLAVDFAVEHVAAVPRDALFGQLLAARSAGR